MVRRTLPCSTHPNNRFRVQNYIIIPKQPIRAQNFCPLYLVCSFKSKGGFFQWYERIRHIRKNLSNGKVVYVEAQYELDGDVLFSKNMWADLSSKVVDARRNSAPKLTSDNVILAEDVAKIHQDAEMAMQKSKNLQDNTEIMQRPDGTVYGWAENGEVYLTEESFNPNSPIHEYTHLWAEAVKSTAVVRE